jgi:hypothetical protein
MKTNALASSFLYEYNLVVPAEEEAPVLLQHEGLLQRRGVGRLLPPVEVLLHYVAAHNINVTGRVCYLM